MGQTEKRKKRQYLVKKFCVDSEIVQVTISSSTQDFFNLQSDDIPFILSEYLKVDEKHVLNVLEDISEKTGFSLSWLVEFIIIRSHYKDLYEINNQYIQQNYT